MNTIRTLAEGKALDIGAVSTELLQEMEKLGLEIRLENGRYQLNESLELLHEDAIRAQITPPTLVNLGKLDIHWSIGSTNDYLLSKMPRENCHGYVCIAEQQTSGKGRRGRKWISPFGRNLCMSIGWLLPKNTSGISALSLVVGIETAELLREMGLEGVRLKWPNDLLLVGSKLGGILIEMVLSTDNHGLVIGMGINFESGIPDQTQVDQPVGYIPVTTGIGRNELAGKILNRLLPALERFASRGFSPYKDRWADLNLYQNRAVNIHNGDLTVTGIDRGIDNEGNLILDRDGNLMNFSSGEVSLRPA